ncbi:MAG: hypothetical protein Kow001_14260 [Acidobacteriota bacterium]
MRGRADEPARREMQTRYYRVWLTVEEVDREGGADPRLVEQIELACFHTLEEALTYRYRISQKCSPRMTGEVEVIRQMTAPESYSAGD